MPPASIADIIPSTKALREAAKRLHSAMDSSFKGEKIRVSRSKLSCFPSEPELAASVKRYNEEIERHANDLQSLLAPLQNLLRCAKLEPPSRPSLRHLGDRHDFVRVCNTCQNVARRTPDLWTRISVCDTETDEQHALFAEELELTGKRPLDVRLIHLKSKSRIIAPTKSWNLLKKESKRWRPLTLKINSHEFHVMTPSDERLDCQSLEALCLNHNVLSPDPSYINPKYDLPHLLLPEISNATSLRTVQIKVESVGGGWKQKVCFLETWRLIDLSLCFERCGDATRFLPILEQQAGTLQRLNLAFTKIWVPEDGKLGTHATSISMHKLTELSCQLDATPLISCIQAPELRSLTINEHPGVLTDCTYNTISADDARKTGDAARKIADVGEETHEAAEKTNDARDAAKPPEALPSVANRVKTYTFITSLSISNVDWPTDSLLLVLYELIQLKSLKLNESNEKHFRTLVTKTFVRNMMPGGCVLMVFLTGLKELHITLGYAPKEDQEMINLLRDMAGSRSKDGLKACIQQYDDPQMKKTIDIWS
ncbi:hypothetical protein FB107DRAFT_292838 [Schizophyllum commune]